MERIRATGKKGSKAVASFRIWTVGKGKKTENENAVEIETKNVFKKSFLLHL